MPGILRETSLHPTQQGWRSADDSDRRSSMEDKHDSPLLKAYAIRHITAATASLNADLVGNTAPSIEQAVNGTHETESQTNFETTRHAVICPCTWQPR